MANIFRIRFYSRFLFYKLLGNNLFVVIILEFSSLSWHTYNSFHDIRLTWLPACRCLVTYIQSLVLSPWQCWIIWECMVPFCLWYWVALFSLVSSMWTNVHSFSWHVFYSRFLPFLLDFLQSTKEVFQGELSLLNTRIPFRLEKTGKKRLNYEQATNIFLPTNIFYWIFWRLNFFSKIFNFSILLSLVPKVIIKRLW